MPFDRVPGPHPGTFNVSTRILGVEDRRMDVLTVSFLVFGAIGAGGVVLHYAGYIPRPYRDRLERTETTLAANLAALAPRLGVEVESALNRAAAAQRGIVGDIGLEVEGALNRVAAQQRGEMAEAAKAAEAESTTPLTSPKMRR